MVDIKSFDACIDLASSGKKHLMLGNGFSVALFPEIFNYKTLAANIESDRINQLFEAIDTHDFEFVMRRLYEASQIVPHYEGGGPIQSHLQEDIEELKSTLIKVISKCHPALPSAIEEQQYQSCQKFLENFEGSKKYSFNYDLILYWVHMHFKDDDTLNLNSDDGFRYDNAKDHDMSVYWEIGRETTQNLYYLHGAMHIFSDGSEIEKLSYANIGKPLSEQVKEAVDQNKFPVFISEGTTSHKIARIKKNGYLARAFSSLKSIGGNLFIFGHSIRDEDDHVFNIVNENRGIKKVFISLHGDGESAENKKITKKVGDWKTKYPARDYIFYSAESAKVWTAL